MGKIYALRIFSRIMSILSIITIIILLLIIYTNKHIELNYTITHELNLILNKSKSALDLLESSNDAVTQASFLLKNLTEQIKKLSDRLYSFNDSSYSRNITLKFADTFSNLSEIATEICIYKENNPTAPDYLYLIKMLEEGDKSNLGLLSPRTYKRSHRKRSLKQKNSIPSEFRKTGIKTKSLLIIFKSILTKLHTEVVNKGII